jgi:hypothetical protein
VLRVADLELRRVHADSEAARAGGHIVAGEGALVLLGKFPVAVEGQRLGWDYMAGEEMGAEIHRTVF